LTKGERVNWTSPRIFTDNKEEEVDHCKVFDVDYSETVEQPLIVAKITDRQLSATRDCKRWDYDREKWPETVVSQFNLVCHRDYWRSLSQSLYMFGLMIGAFGSGILSDNLEEKS